MCIHSLILSYVLRAYHVPLTTWKRERHAFCAVLTVHLDIRPQIHHVIPEQSTQIHISCCAVWSLGSTSYIQTYAIMGLIQFSIYPLTFGSGAYFDSIPSPLSFHVGFTFLNMLFVPFQGCWLGYTLLAISYLDEVKLYTFPMLSLPLGT